MGSVLDFAPADLYASGRMARPLRLDTVRQQFLRVLGHAELGAGLAIQHLSERGVANCGPLLDLEPGQPSCDFLLNGGGADRPGAYADFKDSMSRVLDVWKPCQPGWTGGKIVPS